MVQAWNQTARQYVRHRPLPSGAPTQTSEVRKRPAITHGTRTGHCTAAHAFPSSGAQGLKSSPVRGVECEWRLLRRIWTLEACTHAPAGVSHPRTPEWCRMVAQPAQTHARDSRIVRRCGTMVTPLASFSTASKSSPSPVQSSQVSQRKGRPECAFKRSGTAASARTHHPPAEPRRSTAVVSGREW